MLLLLQKLLLHHDKLTDCHTMYCSKTLWGFISMENFLSKDFAKNTLASEISAKLFSAKLFNLLLLCG